jgi:hypothetical protein
MNEFSKEDGAVLLCSIIPNYELEMLAGQGGDYKVGELYVEFVPTKTEDVQMYCLAYSRSKFQEQAVCYQRSCIAQGKPDRGQGRRYQ